MTHPGDTTAGQPQLSTVQRAHIDTQIDHALTDPTLSDEEVAAFAESVAAMVVPSQPRADAPRPASAAHADEAEPEWAQDQTPLAPPPMRRDSALSGGGGQVTRPTLPPPAVDEPAVDDDEDDEAFPLWRPPPRPAVEIPDNVAAITPVSAPEPVCAADPEPQDSSAGDHSFIPAAAGGAAAWVKPLAAVKERWSNLDGWVKVAAIVGAVVSLLVVQQIMMAQRKSGNQQLAAPPPPAVVTPTAEAGGPAVGPLQPGCPPNSAPGCLPVRADDCPGGVSTDASLAFGADKTQAWVCGRAHNIDLEEITIDFPRPVVVTSICVVPGFAYAEPNGRDHWLEHRLVTGFNWNIGGQQMVQPIKPTREGTCWDVPRIAAQQIIGTVLSSERPPAVQSGGKLLPGILGGPDGAKVDESIAISQITINGYQAGAT